MAGAFKEHKLWLQMNARRLFTVLLSRRRRFIVNRTAIIQGEKINHFLSICILMVTLLSVVAKARRRFLGDAT